MMEASRDHRAATHLYKRAIIQALDELQDFNLRSNIDSIRRHVQSSLGPDHNWNDTIFLKTMKTLIHEGDVEQCANVNCGLSPNFKKRRTKSCNAAIEKRMQQQSIQLLGNFTHMTMSRSSEKGSPIKKSETTKLKIIPKKIYDGLHVPIQNPMDTKAE